MLWVHKIEDLKHIFKSVNKKIITFYAYISGYIFYLLLSLFALRMVKIHGSLAILSIQ